MHQNEERQHNPPINPFLCTRCGDRFPSYRPFIEHAKAHQLLDEEEQKDSIGSQHLIRKESPLKDAEFKQMEIKEENNNSFVCIECDALFSSYKLLMDHKKSHQFIDEKGSVLQEQIREKVREQVSQAKKLGRVGVNKNGMVGKYGMPENSEKDKIRHYKCDNCNYSFKTSGFLSRHLKDKICMKYGMKRPPEHSEPRAKDNKKIKKAGDNAKLISGQNDTIKDLDVHTASPLETISFDNQVKVNKPDVKGEYPEELFCEKCSKGFATVNNLRRHVRDLHSGPAKVRVIKPDMPEADLEKLICKKCMKSFSTRCNLRKHIQEFHSDVCKFHCKKCKLSFKVAQKLKQHLKYKRCTHPGRSKTFKENPESVAKEEMDRDVDLGKSGDSHPENHLKKEECSDGSRRSSQRIAMHQTVKVEEPDNLSKSLIKSAAMNPKKKESIGIKEELDVTPLKEKHSDQSTDLERKDGKHQCNQCGRCFRKDNLIRHQREKVCTNSKEMKGVHLKEPRYKCNKCPSAFYFSADLAQHSVDQHSDLKPFVRDTCGEKFSTGYGLKHHITNKRTFLCAKCKIEFPDKSGLRDHRQQEHGLHVCEVCFKSFPYAGGLERHSMTHSDARPHACNTCDKTYKYKDDLAVHMRVHTNQQSDKAENADQQSDKIGHPNQQSDKIETQIGTSRRSNRIRKPRQIKDLSPVSSTKKRVVSLSKHQRKNKTIMQRQNLRQKMPIKDKVQSRRVPCNICKEIFSSKKDMCGHKREEHPESLHKCKICSWGFVFFGQLQRHMLVHSDDRPFECDVCDVKFKRKEDLKAHKLRHIDN